MKIGAAYCEVCESVEDCGIIDEGIGGYAYGSHHGVDHAYVWVCNKCGSYVQNVKEV